MLNAKNDELVIDRETAQKQILNGIRIVHEAVACTLGPKGKNVIIERPGMLPLITKDGVTVARAVHLRDRVKSMGADLVKEASSQTNDEAGDGTTTATVLTYAMCHRASQMLLAGYDQTQIKSEMEDAVERVRERLLEMAIPVDLETGVTDVATVSANGDTKIGDMIAAAVKSVGQKGLITVENNRGAAETTLELIDGTQLPVGFVSPYFINDERKMQCTLENPLILITDTQISSMHAILPMLEIAVAKSRPVLIIASDITGDALQGLILNTTKGMIRACAVRAPSFGSIRMRTLSDVAALLDATVHSSASGIDLADITIDQLGSCKKVIIDKQSCTLIGGAGEGERVRERITAVTAALADPTLEDGERCELNDSLARLSQSAAIIRVGGATELAARELRDRVDDALNSTRSAMSEGIVNGGGIALIDAAACLDGLMGPGHVIIREACSAPFKTILSNAGTNADIALERIASDERFTGYDARADMACDMMSAGIIDPVSVTRSALKNAQSVAALFITLGCAVLDKNELTPSNTRE